MIRNILKISGLLFVLFFITSNLEAQKMSIGYIYPAGAERGTTTDIVVGGLNVSKATGVVVSGKGVTAEIIKPTEDEQKEMKKKRFRKLDDQSSPQLADQLKMRISIDKNAIPGMRDLRLESTAGVSNKLNFEIGQYPNVPEVKGSTARKPNQVEKLPAVLCGQILPGETDYFSFNAPKGMTLVASVKARALVPFIADAVPGWFQSVISLKNSKGKEVAYCDDYRYNVDPTIIYKVPENETYTLAIHDAVYRGREDFTYRIDVGEIPFIESIYPAAGKTGKKTAVKLIGVNLRSTELNYVPKKDGYNTVVAEGINGGISNPVLFWGVNAASSLSVNDRNKRQITDNQVFLDTLDVNNRSNKYSYTAKANETVTFNVMARRIGSLLDGRLRLLDASGKLLAESDDVEDDTQGLMTFHADPQLTYTFKTPGKYQLELEDVLDKRGRDYFYVLEKKKTVQPFEVFVSPAILSIAKGGTSIFTVNIDYKAKLKGKIELNLSGLPAGTELSNMTIFAPIKKKEISVTLPENSREGSYDLKCTASLVNQANESESKPENAVVGDEMMQAFYYHHIIPAAGFSLEVTPKAPFRLEFPSDLKENGEYQIPFVPSDSLLRIPVRIKRSPGFNDPIELSVYPKSKNIVVPPTTVSPDETEKTVIITIRPGNMQKQRYLRYPVSIVGTVNGEIDQRGKRTFENAKYREISPIIVIRKE